MSERRWPLSPRAARVFYNVADAWLEPAGGGADWVAGLAALDERSRRRLERTLRWIEWSPRLALRSRHGFSWLPRAERRAWLERLAAARWASLRTRVTWLLEQTAVAQRGTTG